MKVVEFICWSNPAYLKGNERERCEVAFCQYAGECKLYNEGKCISVPNLFGRIRCPHAKTSKQFGLTKRARGFGEASARWKELYKTDIQTEYEMMRECGNYIYLPIQHLEVLGTNKIDDALEKGYFIPKEKFTVDFIHSVVHRMPRAIMGGIIMSYQVNEVPKFVRQLKEFSPILYCEYLIKHPEDKERLDSICGNYIGRKAYLNTLADGATYIDCHKNKWVKQDGYLVCDEYSTWLALGKEKRICKQEIKGDEIVKITSNDFVLSTTKFVD